jgi:hypothetical protein
MIYPELPRPLTDRSCLEIPSSGEAYVKMVAGDRLSYGDLVVRNYTGYAVNPSSVVRDDSPSGDERYKKSFSYMMRLYEAGIDPFDSPSMPVQPVRIGFEPYEVRG